VTEEVTTVFEAKELSMGCRKYEARLEDYLNGAPDAKLESHLASCARCRAALQDARLAGTWLREAWEPFGEPRGAFAAGVAARIRAAEAEAASPTAFWRPIELLASRIALTAATVLLALSAYLYKYAPLKSDAPPATSSDAAATYFPQPPAQPTGIEELAATLNARSNGR